MRVITLTTELPEAEADAYGGQLLDDRSYDLLIQGEDVRVNKPNGDPLIVLRHKALTVQSAEAAWRNLRDAATPSFNRGMAAGKIQDKPVGDDRPVGEVSGTRYRAVKKDGTLSNTTHASEVLSGIVGYFDRNPRFPYCRTTAYNLEHPERFAAAMPFIREVDAVFKAELPDRYAAQMEAISRTNSDFYIHGTAFSTVTVNKNWQTATHKDAGDYKPGFGVLTALRAGSYDGCYLCFPRYRVAVDMQTCDVLLADVHEWHGNTPLRPLGPYERISCVFYYREGMWKCGSATEELELAKATIERRLAAQMQVEDDEHGRPAGPDL